MVTSKNQILRDTKYNIRGSCLHWYERPCSSEKKRRTSEQRSTTISNLYYRERERERGGERKIEREKEKERERERGKREREIKIERERERERKRERATDREREKGTE